MYVQVYVCIYIYLCTCVCAHINVRMYLRICVHLYVCMCINTCVCIYKCASAIHISISIYAYTPLSHSLNNPNINNSTLIHPLHSLIHPLHSFIHPLHFIWTTPSALLSSSFQTNSRENEETLQSWWFLPLFKFRYHVNRKSYIMALNRKTPMLIWYLDLKRG